MVNIQINCNDTLLHFTINSFIQIEFIHRNCYRQGKGGGGGGGG